MRYHDSSHHGQTCGEWLGGQARVWAGLLTVIILYLQSEIFMIQYQGFGYLLASLIIIQKTQPERGIYHFKVQSRVEETNISNSMIYFWTIWTN